jgi:AcrR family transcriptional regulator
VYRHFGTKTELRDAVVEGWLKRVSDPLQKIADSNETPVKRLRHWFDALRKAKRVKITSDPELFKVTREIFSKSHDVVKDHVAHLVGQLERIISDGVAAGVFMTGDPHETALAMFDAMARFHDPAHAAEWNDPATDAAFERVYVLITAGLLR